MDVVVGRHTRIHATTAKAPGLLGLRSDDAECLGLGGIGFALMRCAMASELGADVSIPPELRCDHLGAFAEFDSGFLVSIDPTKRDKLDDDFVIIGEVNSDTVKIDEDVMSVQDIRGHYFAGGYGGQA